MNILVIGGTGFIGTPLVQALAAAGHHITVATRGRTENRLAQCPGVTMVPINRKDICGFQKSFEGETFDAIYDLAAFAPRDVILVADTFPKTVRYILVSTASVYGTTEGLAISEATPVTPLSWHDYGRNKWLTEQEVYRFPQLDPVIVRPCLVYGPYDPHEPRVSHFFVRIYHQVPIIIPGHSDAHNNYLYVGDLARLLCQALSFPSQTVVNAAGGETFTWPDYLATLATVMDKPLPPCHYLGMSLDDLRQWEHCHELPFHHNAFYDFALDIERAAALGWQPQVSLRQGLSDCWRWLQQERHTELEAAAGPLAFDRQLANQLEKK